MECKHARKLIDERLQEQPEAEGEDQRDWSELDAHLAGCPKCSADWLELLRTRNLLAPLSDDAPTEQEVTSMWQAIQTAGPAPLTVIAPSTGRRLFRYLAACAGVAAVLFIALQLGNLQYGAGIDWPGVGRFGGERPVMSLELAAHPADTRALRRAVTHASPDPAELQRLQALGYLAPDSQAERRGVPIEEEVLQGRSSASRSAELAVPGRAPAEDKPSTAEAFWNLVQSGDGSVDQYIFPSADELADVSLVYSGSAAGAGQPVTDSVRIQLPTGSTAVGTDFKPTAPPELPPAPDKPTGQTDGGAFLFASISLHGVTEPDTGQDAAAVQEQADEPMTPPAPSDRQPPSTRTPAQPQPKIIKTGELGVEVADYEAAVERIGVIVTEHGAFVADGATQEETGGALMGRVVIRVLPERFDALFAALKAVGRVESENVKAADVTAEYVDIEARIESLRITEQRLQELVKSKSFIDKIESLLEVERELTRVRSQIEQFQGHIRVMADRIALSTITVTLREPARMVPSASMSVEVPVLADAADALAEALAGMNGRLTSGQTCKRDDGTLKGEYTLEISLARFGDLLNAVEALGRVDQRQIKDWHLGDASQPWAERTKCQVALVVFERSRPLPKGTMQVEIDALSAALDALNKVLATCDGSITSNRTTRRDDGSHVGQLNLSVPAGRFADLTDGLATLGRTTAKQIAGEAGQIVGGAASVLCQLALTLAERPREVPVGHMAIEVDDFAKARDSLIELVDKKSVEVLESSSSQRNDGTWVGAFRLGVKAGDMEEAVAWMESLGKVLNRRITGLGLGDLSRIDPDALGTIGLALAEKSAISPEPDRAGASIRGRLRDGLAGLYTSLGLIVYGLVVFAPWLIIILLAAWAIMRLRRKRVAAPRRQSKS
ncbi:MAG TPA: DUF4349 domain-containing protein [Phycisphaerae bacterium]|nr:DUF4349 domain-containing protein [Phycisphaerae bacterium]